MGSDRAMLWNTDIWRAEVRLLTGKAETEAVPRGVATEGSREA